MFVTTMCDKIFLCKGCGLEQRRLRSCRGRSVLPVDRSCRKDCIYGVSHFGCDMLPTNFKTRLKKVLTTRLGGYLMATKPLDGLSPFGVVNSDAT